MVKEMAEGKRKQEAESSNAGDGAGVSTLFASSFFFALPHHQIIPFFLSSS
jgi:hypothetical protein